MSFVMIAAGPSSCARVHTLSLRSLLVGCTLASLGLLSAGVGLGYWLSPADAPAAQPALPRTLLPFAVEQLGALSGRLFRLESQALQLGRSIGEIRGQAPRAPQPAGRATVPSPASPTPTPAAGSGGPMLPPRLEKDAVDDLSAMSERVALLEQRLAQVSDAATLENLALMRLPTRLPVDGAELTSAFGNRDDPFTGRRAFHSGFDFAAAAGTAIHAAAGGKVVFAGVRPDFGWVVEIDHGNGLSTRYAHASRLLVQAGALVMPGETIATAGSSGRSTGPHLHFEVLRNGAATDPGRYLAGL